MKTKKITNEESVSLFPLKFEEAFGKIDESETAEKEGID